MKFYIETSNTNRKKNQDHDKQGNCLVNKRMSAHVNSAGIRYLQVNCLLFWWQSLTRLILTQRHVTRSVMARKQPITREPQKQ